eukprot:TRINITY_DN12306_c0_g1_i2.p1 TRINITY_DN12306_c0_g1~~TRINITY_DN12306_c0_g1_i2.p1  ORF type:complete len:183 (-),score=44.07 TRINITY_DN12306_c0_g1_i2:250-798(-)
MAFSPAAMMAMKFPQIAVLEAVIIFLSVLLLLTSFVRRKLERSTLKTSHGCSSLSAFALLRRLQQEPSPKETKTESQDEEEVLETEAPATPRMISTEPERVSTDDVEVVSLGETSSDGWGSLQDQTYSRALLLAHQQLAIKIAKGPPGLERGPAALPGAEAYDRVRLRMVPTQSLSRRSARK